MARAFGILSLLIAALACGCATWEKHGVAPHPPEKIRVAVLPVRVAVRVKHLRNIVSSPSSAPLGADERAVIDGVMRRAADSITQDIEARLAASYFFEVVPDSDVLRALNAAGLAPGSDLDAARRQALGRAVGAQGVLQVSISGYGSIKKSWLAWLIGSGLVEGVAQGIIAAEVVGSVWAAVGVATEETAQEAVEWGGGAYLFGRFYAPVILEAELSSVPDGRVIWSESALASSNRKALERLSKGDREKREVRLSLAARKAADELAGELEKKAWTNLKSADRAARSAAGDDFRRSGPAGTP